MSRSRDPRPSLKGSPVEAAGLKKMAKSPSDVPATAYAPSKPKVTARASSTDVDRKGMFAFWTVSPMAPATSRAGKTKHGDERCQECRE